MIRRLLEYARLIFGIFTHRPIYVAPGLWLRVPWGMANEVLVAKVRAALKEWERKKGKR